MLQFSLMHDGGSQSWQATYLAFHVASRLGAKLNVILIGDTGNRAKEVLQGVYTQIEFGARAAKIEIHETHWPPSDEARLQSLGDCDGLILSRSNVASPEQAQRWLELVNCPIWLVEKAAEFYKMGVVPMELADHTIIEYAQNLAMRLQSPVTGYIEQSMLGPAQTRYAQFQWRALNQKTEEYPEINLLVLRVNTEASVAFPTGNLIILPSERQA